MDIFESVYFSLNPPLRGNVDHPGAKARYENILNNARRPSDFDGKYYTETIPNLIEYWREIMLDDSSTNINLYEFDADNGNKQGKMIRNVSGVIEVKYS